MNLRKLARDKPCQIRLPGCDGGGETTVLAHYRLAGTCGTGMKPPDELGAWACANCHDIVDQRKQTDMERDFVRLAHAEGVMRTQMQVRAIAACAEMTEIAQAEGMY